MVLALAAVPRVIPGEGLLQRKVAQTVIDGDTVGIFHLETTCLILLDHRRILQLLYISSRLCSPVSNEDQVAIRQQCYDMLELTLLFGGTKLTVISMLSIAVFTLLVVVSEEARYHLGIIEDL